MGVEPLEDAIPLPQTVRLMKNLTSTTHGRSSTVDHHRTGGTLYGGSKPSLQAWGQEASAGSSGSSSELRQRSQRDRIWKEVEYLLGSLDRIKAQLTDGTDWERGEIDWINERYNLCKRRALDYVLCLNISEVLRVVSFPGEHLTYLEVARRVIVDCTSRELADAIRQIGLNPHERVYYKARTDLVTVERAEAILTEMIGDGNYVLAGGFLEELGVPAKSATYTALKKELVSRGWMWTTKMVEKKIVKVIRR